jgi:hypothetical protein
MKPLPRHFHTPEDKEVEWYRECCYWGFRSADFGRHLAICEESDSRDAELMLEWMQHWPVDLAPIWRRNYPLVRETAHAFHGIPVEFYE